MLRHASIKGWLASLAAGESNPSRAHPTAEALDRALFAGWIKGPARFPIVLWPSTAANRGERSTRAFVVGGDSQRFKVFTRRSAAITALRERRSQTHVGVGVARSSAKGLPVVFNRLGPVALPRKSRRQVVPGVSVVGRDV